MVLRCARFTRARALLSLKLISKSFRLRFLVMFATRSQLLGASATCAVRLRQPIPVKNYLQNRPSRENNVFPRTSTYCLSAFSFYVLSVPIFTTEESWLPVIKKLTLGRTRGWGGGVMWVDATSLRFFGVFFLEDETPAPDVFSSCSFILRANFETSSVMVISYRYDLRSHE